jgi:prevent-host-death family protein
MSKELKQLNTVDAKNRLNEMINEVLETRRPVVIGKRGKPVAVVVDYETYAREHQAERKKGDATLLLELHNFHDRMRKKYPKGTGDSVEILREMRRGRLGS